MRGSQLSLYLLAGDVAELEAAWRQRVPFLAASSFAPDGSIDIIENLQVEEMGRTRLRVHLVPPWLAGRSAYFAEKVRGSKYLDPGEVPVVEFDRPYSDGAIIRCGRLYAIIGGFAPPIGSEESVERFRKWVHALYAVARKTLVRQPDGTYIGMQALSAVNAGSLELVDL